MPLEYFRLERAYISIVDGYYELFVRNLHGIEVVHVRSFDELCLFPRQIINGLFAVGKARTEVGIRRSQRVILDAHPGNGNVERAPNLQTPDRGIPGQQFLSEVEERIRSSSTIGTN